MQSDENETSLIIDAEALRSEPRGFALEQMVTCDVCLRANPPTRTSCLYCAAQLPTTDLNAAFLKPTLRKLEDWERGFNLIYLPDKTAQLTDDALKRVADLLRLEHADLEKLIRLGKPLPLARTSTAEDVALIETRLADLGVAVIAIADTELLDESSSLRRARAFELTEGALIAHPSAGSAESWSVNWDEIGLIVAGRLFVRQLEVEERKRRKDEGEIVDAREFSSDEPVLDLYFGVTGEGLRISAGNFDYSCLGARKGLIAGQNFSTLIAILREHAGGASYDESYAHLRHALTPVWPMEEHTEGRGWRRKGPGRVNTEAVTTSSNDLQFTRYARLLNYLRVHGPELSK